MNRKLALVVAVVAIALLTLGVVLIPFGPPAEYDVNDYGTVHLMISPSTGEDLGPGDTIPDGKQLSVRWDATVKTGVMTAQLYTVGGTYLQTGTYLKIGDYQHCWGFTLDTIPLGTTEVYVAFSGQYTPDIPWVGSSYHIFVVSTKDPKDTVVVFTDEQEDTSGAGGELITLRWWFVCEGAATGVITVDDVPETPRTITASSGEQPFTYSFQEYTEGDYTVKLTITPEYGDEASSSCEVTVTTTTTPTTTTTTTTDTTTTTPTTTTEPPPEEWEYLWIYALVAVVIIAIILWVKR